MSAAPWCHRSDARYADDEIGRDGVIACPSCGRTAVVAGGRIRKHRRPGRRDA